MRKKLLIYVLFFSFILLLIPFNSIVSADLCDVLLSGFDDVASGLDSGTSVLFDFENTGDVNKFETSTDYDLSFPNSLKVEDDNTVEGYLNLTQDFDYIGSVNFTVYLHLLAAGRNYQFLNFTDYNDNVVFSVRISCAAPGNNHIIYWDDIGTWRSLYSVGAGADVRFYILITHNFTNQFNIKVLDSSFVELSNDDYAGSSVSTYSNFSYIYITNIGNSGVCDLYYDNFYINYCQDEVYGCDNLDVALFNQDGLPGIRSVVLDTTVVYNYTLIGDVGSRGWLWITEQGDSIPIHVKYLGQCGSNGIVTGQHTIFYSSALYGVQIYSFVVKDYPTITSLCTTDYYEVENFTVNASYVYNYSDTYFIDFQHLKYNPAFEGDSIDIIYHLPENDSASTIHEDYYYLIELNRDGSYFNHVFANTYRLNTTIYDNGGLGVFENTNDGWNTYQLKVFNCSNITGRDLSYSYARYYGILYIESSELIVFDSRDDYNEYLDDQDPGQDDDEEDDSTGVLGEDYNILIGVMISFGIGVGLLMLTRNEVAMFMGVGVTAFILSYGDHAYSLLPVSVAYGLIVVLVLLGVIIWIFD